jgi:RNA polymerase sigma-70 factor (ECF subfamily)
MPSSLSERFLQESFFGNSVKFPEKHLVCRDNISCLLIRVLVSDDYESFQCLFNKMYTPLCHFCFRIVRDRQVCEEVVSDVFFSIWKNRNVLKISAPRAYLFTAVRNRGIDYLRKHKTHASTLCELDKAEQLAHVEEPEIDENLIDAFEKAKASLTPQCRRVFEMSREHDLKYREIATQLNVSIKTVEAQMTQALKQLREAMFLLI